MTARADRTAADLTTAAAHLHKHTFSLGSSLKKTRLTFPGCCAADTHRNGGFAGTI